MEASEKSDIHFQLFKCSKKVDEAIDGFHETLEGYVPKGKVTMGVEVICRKSLAQLVHPELSSHVSAAPYIWPVVAQMTKHSKQLYAQLAAEDGQQYNFRFMAKCAIDLVKTANRLNSQVKLLPNRVDLPLLGKRELSQLANYLQAMTRQFCHILIEDAGIEGTALRRASQAKGRER